MSTGKQFEKPVKKVFFCLCFFPSRDTELLAMVGLYGVYRFSPSTCLVFFPHPSLETIVLALMARRNKGRHEGERPPLEERLWEYSVALPGPLPVLP